MGYWIVDGRKLTNEEYQELQRQEEQDKQRAREEAQRLTKQLGEAYAALKEHLQRNPGVAQRIEDTRVLDQQIYQNLRLNLERADQAPRCQAIKADGTGCGSPKMNNHIYCYAHYRMLEARAEKLVLPSLEDANGIHMAVMVVQRALIDDEISEKKAGLLLYSLQIAATNVDKTTFGQAKAEDLVTEMEDEEESIERQEQIVEKRKRLEEITGRRRSTQIGADQDGRDLPLIGTDNTDQERGEEQNLPRIDADERGSGGKALPLISADGTDGRSGDPVIGTSGDRVTAKAPNSAPSGSALAETYANLG
jgi:hypothetical protein